MADAAAPPDLADRLEQVMRRTLPLLGPEARRALEAVMTRESLAIIAAVLVIWVGSHAFGIGEIIDIILAAVGVVAIGFAVFDGLDHLWQFARLTYSGRSSAEFDRAARHLAEAISILGITAVLAVLFRGRPRTGRGGRIDVGTPPPRRPTTRADPRLAAGEGYTTAWGDVVYSSQGSQADQALVRLHERVHQILTPRLAPLRRIRVQQRTSSYTRSSLSRYLEEALAETVAQVGVNGFRGAVTGVRFPVSNGYVYLVRAGGNGMGGQGVVIEAGALIGIATAGGQRYDVYLREGGR